MLTALAPSGPVVQSVPTSPPSTTDSTQSGRRESFQDVYRSVPSGDESQNEAEPKPKAAASTATRSKKSSTEDGNDKTDVTATLTARPLALQKAPLVFALPSLGQEVESEPASVTSTTEGEDRPEGSTPSTGAAGNTTLAPTVVLPDSKPGQTLATALVPSNEKLAFSARLTQPEAPTATVQPARQEAPPVASRSQTSEGDRTTVEPASVVSGKDPYQTAEAKKTDTSQTVLPVREMASATAFDLRQTPAPLHPPEPAPAASGRGLAIQDIQPAIPEIAKPPARTEILLQLAGQNQSTASVRVVDRLGTVNVTVHAADPDLRSSLRSNLSDLASQLTGQGYKTEMVKPAVIAANADNHDPRQSSRDGSGQQQPHHFTPDGRQPQRDRRPSSGRWRDELEQETSGNPGAPGGQN